MEREPIEIAEGEAPSKKKRTYQKKSDGKMKKKGADVEPKPDAHFEEHPEFVNYILKLQLELQETRKRMFVQRQKFLEITSSLAKFFDAKGVSAQEFKDYVETCLPTIGDIETELESINFLGKIKQPPPPPAPLKKEEKQSGEPQQPKRRGRPPSKKRDYEEYVASSASANQPPSTEKESKRRGKRSKKKDETEQIPKQQMKAFPGLEEAAMQQFLATTGLDPNLGPMGGPPPTRPEAFLQRMAEQGALSHEMAHLMYNGNLERIFNPDAMRAHQGVQQPP